MTEYLIGVAAANSERVPAVEFFHKSLSVSTPRLVI